MGKDAGAQNGWLSGWKEIAHYIGCSVKTARDYEERLKLPVFLVQGPGGAYKKRYAIPSELDRWLRNLHGG
jgi:hypothetical protein